jgi:GTP-binding protein
MKQKVLEAKFVKSINGTDPITDDGLPQVAFIGRSNVGKSTLINSILGQKLARSSSRPGKTVLLDFFRVNNNMYFVDLPGYGYAQRSKERLEHFRRLIAWYLFSAKIQHKLVVLIVDAKVGVTELDHESLDMFTEHKLPFIVAANKVDKLKMGERKPALDAITAECGDVPVIPYSSFTGEGKDELSNLIFAPVAKT